MCRSQFALSKIAQRWNSVLGKCAGDERGLVVARPRHTLLSRAKIYSNLKYAHSIKYSGKVHRAMV